MSGNRSFSGYESLGNFVRDTTYERDDHAYLVDADGGDDFVRYKMDSTSELVKVHSNALFTVYRILEIPRNMSLAH